MDTTPIQCLEARQTIPRGKNKHRPRGFRRTQVPQADRRLAYWVGSIHMQFAWTVPTFCRYRIIRHACARIFTHKYTLLNRIPKRTCVLPTPSNSRRVLALYRCDECIGREWIDEWTNAIVSDVHEGSENDDGSCLGAKRSRCSLQLRSKCSVVSFALGLSVTGERSTKWKTCSI